MENIIYFFRIMSPDGICVANFERFDIACAIRDKYFPNFLIFKI